jgi:hypothetical protein
MQRESGVHYWLKVPFLYNLLQDAIGQTRCIGSFSKAMSEPELVIRLSILDVVQRRSYGGYQTLITSGSTSVQLNIASAKRRHADKGTFVVGDTHALWDDSRFRDADIVMGWAFCIT